jgi:hypothetical protein
VPFQIITDNTLSALVQGVAADVGYPVPNDPAGSTDPAVVQMVTAVNRAGLELLGLFDWQELTKSYTIPVKSAYTGQKERSFDLPEDFYDWIDQTQWNATTQLPGIGPVSPQDWKTLIVRNLQATLSFYWQVRDNKIWILSPPDEEQELTFFYQSYAWVRDQDNTDLWKNRATKNGDMVLLDAVLMSLLTKVKWLEIKGFDSSAAMRDFQINFESRKASEKGAPILNMAGRSVFPLLDARVNTPDTGYGGVGY